MLRRASFNAETKISSSSAVVYLDILTLTAESVTVGGKPIAVRTSLRCPFLQAEPAEI